MGAFYSIFLFLTSKTKVGLKKKIFVTFLIKLRALPEAAYRLVYNL